MQEEKIGSFCFFSFGLKQKTKNIHEETIIYDKILKTNLYFIWDI